MRSFAGSVVPAAAALAAAGPAAAAAAAPSSSSFCASVWTVPAGTGLASWLLARQAANRAFYRAFYDCRLPAKPLPPEPTTRSSDAMHVVYACDAGYFELVVNSALSLMRRVAPGEGAGAGLLLHVVVPELDLARAVRMLGCLRQQGPPELSALSAKVALQSWQPRRVHIDNGASPLLFTKWYLHEYLPAAERALWLDGDTIIRHDVGVLYRSHLRHGVAAAKDQALWTLGYHGTFQAPGVRAHFEDTESPTFNVGVLLLDLEHWRSERTSKQLEQWAEVATSPRGFAADQVALNLAFPRGAYDSLDWRWNALMPNPGVALPQECIDGARILHWAGYNNCSWFLRGQGAAEYPYRYLYEEAEALPLESGVADAVVSTFTLSCVTDPTQAVAEVKRVLKPGGTFLFFEPVLCETDEKLANAQRKVIRSDGCRVDRRTLETIKAAGFKQVESSYFELTGLFIFNPTVAGLATA